MPTKPELLAGRDWTLLAIAAASGRSISPAQLQKSLFLLGRHYPKSVARDFYEFQPYDYGPFNAGIYTDAELLAVDGLVQMQQVPGRRWSEYLATSEGLRRAKILEARVPVEVLEGLHAIVTWARSVSFQHLIRTIYKLFPQYKVRSVFRDEG